MSLYSLVTKSMHFATQCATTIRKVCMQFRMRFLGNQNNPNKNPPGFCFETQTLPHPTKNPPTVHIGFGINVNLRRPTTTRPHCPSNPIQSSRLSSLGGLNILFCLSLATRNVFMPKLCVSCVVSMVIGIAGV